MTRIYVGTCSWSDHTDFYPPGLPSNQQLSFYAQHFPIVEIDSTFYAMMPRRNFELWAQRTPAGFIFDVKPYRQLTWHDRESPPDDDVTRQFRESLEPLRQAGKLGAISFQFPPWFTYRQENLDYIRRCRDQFPDDRLSVEFRHRSWLDGEHVARVVAALWDAGIGLTVVDEPQVGSGSVPTVLEVTTPQLAVVRFHGRNAKTWYAKVERTADRFNYLYSLEELQEWAPNIAHLAERAEELHLLFNNNRDNFAVVNARQLQMVLTEATPHAEIVTPTH